MGIVFTTEGRLWLAQRIWNLAFPETTEFILQLFKNDYTPVLGSVRGNFTDATFTTYTGVTFDKTENGAAALVGNLARVLLTGAAQVWESTGAHHTVYGWFLTNSTNDKVIVAERFAAPVDLNTHPLLRLYPYIDLGKLLAD